MVRVAPGSVDLHHAVGVCWAHGLYDALLRLHTQGLGDYVTALAQLMALLRNAVQTRMKVRWRCGISGGGKGKERERKKERERERERGKVWESEKERLKP